MGLAKDTHTLDAWILGKVSHFQKPNHNSFEPSDTFRTPFSATSAFIAPLSPALPTAALNTCLLRSANYAGTTSPSTRLDSNT